MLIGKVGDGDRVLPGQPVARGERGDSRFGRHRPGLQAALLGGQADVADVGSAVVQDSGLVVPAGPQHVHRELGVTEAQSADRRGHDEAGHDLIVNEPGPWAARVTRRRSASALASSGPASASSCRPAEVPVRHSLV
jgi:hypothetical protein